MTHWLLVTHCYRCLAVCWMILFGCSVTSFCNVRSIAFICFPGLTWSKLPVKAIWCLAFLKLSKRHSEFTSSAVFSHRRLIDRVDIQNSILPLLAVGRPLCFPFSSGRCLRCLLGSQARLFFAMKSRVDFGFWPRLFCFELIKAHQFVDEDCCVFDTWVSGIFRQQDQVWIRVRQRPVDKVPTAGDFSFHVLHWKWAEFSNKRNKNTKTWTKCSTNETISARCWSAWFSSPFVPSRGWGASKSPSDFSSVWSNWRKLWVEFLWLEFKHCHLVIHYIKNMLVCTRFATCSMLYITGFAW